MTRALRLGFDGMELSVANPGPTMLELIDEARPRRSAHHRDLLRASRAADRSDPGQVALAREDIPRLLEGSAALGAPLILVPIYGRNRKFPAAFTGRTQEEDEALWLDGLRAATEDADRTGGTIVVEADQPLREQPLGDSGRCTAVCARHGEPAGPDDGRRVPHEHRGGRSSRLHWCRSRTTWPTSTWATASA